MSENFSRLSRYRNCSIRCTSNCCNVSFILSLLSILARWYLYIRHYLCVRYKIWVKLYQSFGHVGLYCVDKGFRVNPDRIRSVNHSRWPDHFIITTFVRQFLQKFRLRHGTTERRAISRSVINAEFSSNAREMSTLFLEIIRYIFQAERRVLSQDCDFNFRIKYKTL